MKVNFYLIHLMLNSARMLRRPKRVSQMGAAIRKILPCLRTSMVRKMAMPPRTRLERLSRGGRYPTRMLTVLRILAKVLGWIAIGWSGKYYNWWVG